MPLFTQFQKPDRADPRIPFAPEHAAAAFMLVSAGS
jgi:hypothetical protein